MTHKIESWQGMELDYNRAADRCAVSLAGAISLIERGGSKLCASNAMFLQTLIDYRKALEDFRAARAALITGSEERKACLWWCDGEMWESSCGVAYTFLDTDGPAENGHKFCHSCGGVLEVVTTEDD